MLEIRAVTNKKGFKQFLDFPEKIYSGDINWVPKLDMDVKHLLDNKHPYYQHAWKELFLAYRGKKVIGRIAAIIDNNYIDFHEEKTGYFGFFECINDAETAKELFRKCEEALYARGIQNIIGPMNPSSNDECGFIVEGFNMPPAIMMPYNPPYYLELLESAGYVKAKDLLAFNMNVQNYNYDRLERFVKKIKDRTPQLGSRPVNVKNFKAEVDNIRTIYNNAWEKNWGFVPWTDAELDDIAKQMRPLVVPEMVQMGLWEGKPIGFLLALPNYNEVIRKIGRRLLPFGWLKFILLKKKIKSCRLLAMGVAKEYQNKGIGAIMYYNALMEVRKKGYTECEFSWILEDNYETIRIAEMMGGEIHKKYRIFEKIKV